VPGTAAYDAASVAFSTVKLQPFKRERVLVGDGTLLGELSV
jgi:hypothetical protein